ncbi:hypothetical protein CEXT_454161 [Caerostris extrusa]|uniref:Uncharacterized protein n=1 Tax=Caerostris extrusa TaxID=172846 RepID=A0AAV4WSS3_CAEEX|nr:hypothetical protein CEXT_454161 [Caerostris extrusa]
MKLLTIKISDCLEWNEKFIQLQGFSLMSFNPKHDPADHGIVAGCSKRLQESDDSSTAFEFLTQNGTLMPFTTLNDTKTRQAERSLCGDIHPVQAKRIAIDDISPPFHPLLYSISHTEMEPMLNDLRSLQFAEP